MLFGIERKLDHPFKQGICVKSCKSNSCTLPIFFALGNCTMANLQVAEGALYEIRRLFNQNKGCAFRASAAES